MQTVTIDRSKRLKEEPHLGHNRWHPDIPPIVEVDPGEEVVLETRDASDSQVQPGMTEVDMAGFRHQGGASADGPGVREGR